MIRPNLIGTTGNARQIAAIFEPQFQVRLILDRLRQRKSFLQPSWLRSIKALGVLDQLDDLVFLLGLHQHTARRDLHGMEGQIGHTRPRNHQVPRLLEKIDSALVNEVENVLKILVRRKVLVRIGRPSSTQCSFQLFAYCVTQVNGSRVASTGRCAGSGKWILAYSASTRAANLSALRLILAIDIVVPKRNDCV